MLDNIWLGSADVPVFHRRRDLRRRAERCQHRAQRTANGGNQFSLEPPDLALMDPRNLSAQDEIAFASGKRVKVFVAEEMRVLEALEKYYHEECPSRFGLVLDRLNRARFLWEKPAPERAEPAIAA